MLEGSHQLPVDWIRWEIQIYIFHLPLAQLFPSVLFHCCIITRRKSVEGCDSVNMCGCSLNTVVIIIFLSIEWHNVYLRRKCFYWWCALHVSASHLYTLWRNITGQKTQRNTSQILTLSVSRQSSMNCRNNRTNQQFLVILVSAIHVHALKSIATLNDSFMVRE